MSIHHLDPWSQLNCATSQPSADDHSILTMANFTFCLASPRRVQICNNADSVIKPWNAEEKLTAHHLAGKPQRLTVPHRFPLLHSWVPHFKVSNGRTESHNEVQNVINLPPSRWQGSEYLRIGASNFKLSEYLCICWLQLRSGADKRKSGGEIDVQEKYAEIQNESDPDPGRLSQPHADFCLTLSRAEGFSSHWADNAGEIQDKYKKNAMSPRPSCNQNKILELLAPDTAGEASGQRA